MSVTAVNKCTCAHHPSHALLDLTRAEYRARRVQEWADTIVSAQQAPAEPSSLPRATSVLHQTSPGPRFVPAPSPDEWRRRRLYFRRLVREKMTEHGLLRIWKVAYQKRHRELGVCRYDIRTLSLLARWWRLANPG